VRISKTFLIRRVSSIFWSLPKLVVLVKNASWSNNQKPTRMGSATTHKILNPMKIKLAFHMPSEFDFLVITNPAYSKIKTKNMTFFFHMPKRFKLLVITLNTTDLTSKIKIKNFNKIFDALYIDFSFRI